MKEMVNREEFEKYLSSLNMKSDFFCSDFKNKEK
jgi:hypothetical protein